MANNSNKSRIRWVTRTAILIAITVALQALTLQLGNQYITGSIVNMMLILSVMVCGLPSGLTVGAVTPILPTMMGFGPLPPLVPFIMLGNMALVTVWHFVGNIKLPIENASYICALIAGAAVKFGVLYVGIVRIAAPLILGVPDGHPITILFSFPQLITALAGGACAIILLPALKKAIIKEQE